MPNKVCDHPMKHCGNPDTCCCGYAVERHAPEPICFNCGCRAATHPHTECKSFEIERSTPKKCN